MTNIAIKVENLTKRYRLGLKEELPETFIGALTGWLKAPLANYRNLRRLTSFDDERRMTNDDRHSPNGHSSLVTRHSSLTSPADILYALKDVSFEVKHGEVVGIIGRNGAGKSTLLKIISRITKPTAGRVIFNGRVSSLLEVGTGFHPELTGRENVYLNGTILGMTKVEISRKFDEIVDFSGVEQFIDTPVKRYSSGMQVRLAFAVAAHLEPEILLIDEVLAVGDAEFQKKCLGKMGSVAREGRTVVFVSHDMTSVSQLCHRCVLLSAGQVEMMGITESVIAAYIGNRRHQATASWDLDFAPGNETVKLKLVSLSRQNSDSTVSFAINDPILLTIEYVVLRDSGRLTPVIKVNNAMGLTVFSTANYDDPIWGTMSYRPGHYRATCLIPAHILNQGSYTIDTLIIKDMRLNVASVENALSFSVYDNGATRGDYIGDWVGVVRPKCNWSGEVIHVN
jgi:lipopolysaccharide transport system ATP-binding protein